MATRTAVVDDSRNDGKFVITWSGLLNGDVGSLVGLKNLDIISVQLQGTAGTGPVATIQGSNDGGTSWGTLHGPGGADAILTSIGQWVAVIEAPLGIRPSVTGDGSTDLTVSMVASVRRA